MMGRLISFDHDIVNDVFSDFQGKYTKEQIQNVLDSFTAYLKQLQAFDDSLMIRVPRLGTFVANHTRVKYKLNKLLWNGITEDQLDEVKKHEYNANIIRDKKLTEIRSNGTSVQDRFFRDNNKFVNRIFQYSPESIQDKQDKQFYRR